MWNLKVSKQEKIEHAIANKIYLNKNEYSAILEAARKKAKDPCFVQIKHFVFLIGVASYAKPGEVYLSKMQRSNLRLSTTMDYANVRVYVWDYPL